MTSENLVEVELKVGKITIYSDDDGVWLEVNNGHHQVEVSVTATDLDRLRHAILNKDTEIKRAQK